MNKALLGALGLGIGSNVLMSALDKNRQGATPPFNPTTGQKPPGFSDQLAGGVKQAFMDEAPKAAVRAGLGMLGFEKGGAVYREGGGGLWQGLQDIMKGKNEARARELNKINEALGIEGQMEATTDQARLMAERQAIINEVLGRNKPAPQAAPQAAPLGAPVTAQVGSAAPVDETLLMEPIGGYTDPKDRIKAQDFLMAPLGPEASHFNKGGIAIKKGNEGKFTAKANAAGEGVQEYARKVLSAPEGRYPASTRKQANFARNAAQWHSTGGTALARKKNAPDGFTGATKKVMAPSGETSFMMEHGSGAKERMGPLAKTVYKNKGGEVWERSYHNPMAGLTGGSKDKEE